MGTVREITYQLLRELEMTTIFGNPGSTELPFLRNMPPDFSYILALHERSAAGIGLGYALGKGKAAFVNLHSIASAGNGLSAIIDALYNHVPLVVTTGQQDRRQLLARPFLESRAAEVVRPYVKWVLEPARAEDLPAAIAGAYYTVMEPSMGPVFLSVPMDDWTHECEPITVRRVQAAVLADRHALDEVVSVLNASHNPAIVLSALKLKKLAAGMTWLRLPSVSRRMSTRSRFRRVGRSRETIHSFRAVCCLHSVLWQNNCRRTTLFSFSGHPFSCITRLYPARP